MHEVKPRSGSARGREMRVAAVPEIDLVPAHVWDREPGAADEPLHLGGKAAEARDARRLFTRLEQDLKPETTPEVGDAARHGFAQRFGDRTRQLARDGAETTLARNDHAVRLADRLRIARTLDDDATFTRRFE